MIYLYLKTHNQTGLKYLGKTVNDPFKYKGSGTRWLRHLAVHGNDVTTQILQICENEHEIKEWGLYYSNLWNVVDNKQFANLMEETGSGGVRDEVINMIVSSKLKEHNQLLSAEYKKQRSSHAGKSFWDKVRNDPVLKERISLHRKQQINPMKGKTQKRVCCLQCKKDLPINQLKTHHCK